MAWSQEQVRNAQVIYQVGTQLGASLRDIQIAIMAAIVESGLRNLDYGDRDSIGMFQQRDAWGSRSDRLDPYKSARMFFLGGAAGQRGLLDFSNRDQMGMGEAAQSVQVSAFPDRYQEHASEAEALLGQVGDGSVPAAPDPGTLGEVPDTNSLLSEDALKALEFPSAPSVTEVNGLGEITADATGIGELGFGDANARATTLLDTPQFGVPTTDPMDILKMPSLDDLGITQDGSTTTTDDGLPGTTVSSKIGDIAKKFLGTPYVWGGTSPSGFDCSGFVQYVYKKMGIDLPRISADQARAGKRVGLDNLQVGDLVALDNSSRNNGADHIGIYLGNGIVIHAPRPGSVVELANLQDVFGGGWGVRL